jgi:hypothetical protein
VAATLCGPDRGRQSARAGPRRVSRRVRPPLVENRPRPRVPILPPHAGQLSTLASRPWPVRVGRRHRPHARYRLPLRGADRRQAAAQNGGVHVRHGDLRPRPLSAYGRSQHLFGLPRPVSVPSEPCDKRDSERKDGAGRAHTYCTQRFRKACRPERRRVASFAFPERRPANRAYARTSKGVPVSAAADRSAHRGTWPLAARSRRRGRPRA